MLEDNVLSDEDYGSMDSIKRFYILRGFNEAMALITSLSHNYADTAAGIKDRLLAPDYLGLLMDLDIEEDD